MGVLGLQGLGQLRVLGLTPQGRYGFWGGEPVAFGFGFRGLGFRGLKV